MGFSSRQILLVAVVALLATGSQGLVRCIQCRSRGELGSCKDPFTMNVTQIENEKGVDLVPCSSGWCSKIIERPSINNEHGQATDRFCLQHGPEDNEERCAETTKNYHKVLMCFCHGDLCNSATQHSSAWALYAMTLLGTYRLWVLNC